MKNEGAVALDYFISGDSHRKHGGRALCPKHDNCEFTDCRCIKPHWRGTHCSRDRRDKCPTCINLPKEQKIFKK